MLICVACGNDFFDYNYEAVKTRRYKLYIYISWEAYNNEPLPYKRICVEIERVLKDVNSQ